jgi:hypothetical protein
MGVVVVVDPAATDTVEGEIVATVVSPLARVKVVPPAGAGVASVNVANTDLPSPITDDADRVMVRLEIERLAVPLVKPLAKPVITSLPVWLEAEIVKFAVV